MLGKLIKHEFKTTSRYILLIMAILVILTPIAALYLRYSGGFIDNLNVSSDILDTIQSLFSGLCIFTYVIAVIGVAVTTFISLIYRFYKSMISSEGYLTHTLPAKISSILFSKGFVAFIWTIASMILIILSIAVFTRILGVWSMDQLLNAVKSIGHTLSSVGVGAGHCIYLILSYIIQTICKIAMIGACFAIGHKLNGHPILGAIISYIVITLSLQIITSIVMAVVMPVVYGLFENVSSVSTGLYLMLTGVTLYNVLFTAIFSFITVYMFKNKLNI